MTDQQDLPAQIETAFTDTITIPMWAFATLVFFAIGGVQLFENIFFN